MSDDCTPEARITKSLLGYGVLAGVVYVAGSVLHGVLTPSFDFTRDSWSLLSRGPAGWIHVVVFVVTGLMVAAAGVGFRRHARGAAGVALVAYGLLLVVAGIAAPDAPGGAMSPRGLVHLASGGLGFIAFAVAAFSTARRFGREGARGWAVFSVVAGVALIVGFVAIASGSSSAPIVLGFTASVVLSWVWLALASIRSYRQADAIGRADARERAVAAVPTS